MNSTVAQNIDCLFTGPDWSPGWRGMWEEETGSTMTGSWNSVIWPMGKQSLFLLREGPWKSRPLRSVRSELYMWDTQWSIHYSTLCFIEHSRCCYFIGSWRVTFFPSEHWQVAFMLVPTLRPLEISKLPSFSWQTCSTRRCWVGGEKYSKLL